MKLDNLIKEYEQGKLKKGLYYVVATNKSQIGYYEGKSWYKLDSGIESQLRDNVEGIYKVPDWEELNGR